MTPADTIERLANLTRGIRTCMLTTLDEEGRPHSRPMATPEVTPQGVLYFMTSKSSHKSREIEEERTVNLSFADDAGARYVSITGRAELQDDRAKIRELWSPLYKAWWPEGVDDPDIVLLAIEIEQAEYWDSPGGKVTQLLSIAKKALTGREEQQTDATNGRVDLH